MYRYIFRMNRLIGFASELSVNPEHGSQDTSCYLMIPQRSREQQWNPSSGKHNLKTHFPKDPNCGVFLKTKITRASSRKNHHIPSWCKIWQHSGCNPTRQSTIFSGDQKNLMKFLGKPKVFDNDNSLEVGRSWYRMVGGFDYHRNIQDLLFGGKTSFERRFGMSFNGPVIPFGEMVEYLFFLLKTNLDCSSLEQNSCWENFSVMHFTRWEFRKETSWLQTLKNWRRWTRNPRRFNANEELRPWEVSFFKIPSRRWYSQHQCRISTFETIPFNQGSSWTRRGRARFSMNFRWITFSNPTQCGMIRKLQVISRQLQEIISRHYVEFRVKLHVPREESFHFPLKYVDVTRLHMFHWMFFEGKYFRLLKRGWRKRMSGHGHFLTRFISLNEMPQDGNTWSGERRGHKDFLVQTTCRQICGSLCLMQLKRKQNKDGLSRPKFDNAKTIERNVLHCAKRRTHNESRS